jgi:16S rRNA (guanine527-N7)-methyltransferase
VTEDQAQDWIRERFGARSFSRLNILASMVAEESTRQNLIAASTRPHLWVRHVLDSAQLLTWDRLGPWLDIGTGAGFPGMVLAVLRGGVFMVEPRRRRAEFLRACLDALGLSKGNDVLMTKVQAVPSSPYAVISARAVTATTELFASAIHCSSRETIWILPKGRNVAAELAAARSSWHGTFHVKQSISDCESRIIVAEGIHRR